MSLCNTIWKQVFIFFLYAIFEKIYFTQSRYANFSIWTNILYKCLSNKKLQTIIPQIFPQFPIHVTNPNYFQPKLNSNWKKIRKKTWWTTLKFEVEYEIKTENKVGKINSDTMLTFWTDKIKCVILILSSQMRLHTYI